MTAAKVLALTGADILTDADFQARTKADFDQRTEGFTHRSPLPDDVKEPVGLPDDMPSHGTVMEVKAEIMKHAADHEYAPHTHQEP
ncbi:MAG TPA: hypothetical protein VFA46_12410 [Actinomycetes bacterium]|nr:hypothetical protein [Actinomycetes bacterium]